MTSANLTIQPDERPEGALQDTLAQIRGVVASRIVLDNARQVMEIHVIASTERNPKRIIRDVETLLLVRHGLNIDYRKISLVQLTQDQLADNASQRPLIRNVSEVIEDGQRKIRVEIQSGRRRFTGLAEEPVEQGTMLETTARATLHSISKLMRHNADLELEHVGMVDFGSSQVLTVVVKCFAENQEDKLVGACFIGPRPLESAVRATLDALNRRFSAWL